ncbi:MAG: GTP pyrophosphokinase [Deltaproteobacteria bacterium]|nr:MAG: GTP pyrophosphokinase [Deltaproteobacteria bacterium]
MIRLQDIIDRVRASRQDADVDLIKKAYVYSAQVHKGQLRRSGEPYLVHPLGVAFIIAQLNLDEQSVVAALLHDTLEDTLATAEDIESLFGKTVLFLVEGVTKLAKVTFHSGEQRQAESVRKMLVAMSEDIRVVLVKLADRLDNMRTLEYLEPDRRDAIAAETLEIYAPLANRLGIYWIRRELEDLSFRWLHPAQWEQIQQHVAHLADHRKQYIDGVVDFLEKTIIEKNGIEAQVSGRIKHPYSIFRKMQSKGLEFDEVQDIIAFRIIVDNVENCYRVLGIIHALWKPVVGRFKDYIAMPKINRYQSLHTTVVGPEGERVEIQIRTHEMHRVAEFGIAAHWAYKEGWHGSGKNGDFSQFSWLRELLSQQQDLRDPDEILETVKVNLFADEVFTFTPRGDVIALPAGATALDFAYAVHSEVGHHCVGARINNKIAPLRQKLRNGDTVEILTHPKQRPSKDWLSFVKTSRARTKIRAVVRAEQRRRSKEIGRELLEKEAKRRRVNLNRKWRSGEIGRVAEELGLRNTDELLAALGYGKLSANKVVELLLPEEKRQEAREALEQTRPSRIVEALKKPLRRSRSGILVDGLNDVMVRMARCCNPIPGDRLVGVVTRGRGVTVHSVDCRRLAGIDPARRIQVRWDSSLEKEAMHAVTIRLRCEDRPGLLANVTAVLSEVGINISQVNAKAEAGGLATCQLKLLVHNLDELKSVLRKIEKIKGVRAAERMRQ